LLFFFHIAERAATYSKIITPEEYNRIISKEHLYISTSDRVIKDFIEIKAHKKQRAAHREGQATRGGRRARMVGGLRWAGAP
jgi:hypothetical protein